MASCTQTGSAQGDCVGCPDKGTIAQDDVSAQLQRALFRDENTLAELQKEESQLRRHQSLLQTKERRLSLQKEKDTLNTELNSLKERIDELTAAEAALPDEERKRIAELKKTLGYVADELASTKTSVGRPGRPTAAFGRVDADLERNLAAQEQIKRMIELEKAALKETGGSEGGGRK